MIRFDRWDVGDSTALARWVDDFSRALTVLQLGDRVFMYSVKLLRFLERLDMR